MTGAAPARDEAPDLPASPARMAGSGNLAALLTAGIAMAARVSGQVAIVGVTLVATRVLAPADFGVFAVAAALVTLARTLLYTGPFEYLLMAPAARAARIAGACLSANLLVASASLALLVAAALAAPLLFRGEGVGAVLMALAPSTPVAAIAGWLESLMLRAGRVRPYYAITVVVEVSAGLAAVMLLLSGWGLWALVAQVWLRMGLFVLVYGAILAGTPVAVPARGEVAEVIRWSASRYGSVLVGFLSNYSGDLVLGVALSPAAAGLFRAANRMVTALSDMFLQPAQLLTASSLGAARAEGRQVAGQWLRLCGLFATLAWPALALLALQADRIVPLLLGPAWSAAAPLVTLFALARMAALVATVSSSSLVVASRQRRVLGVQASSALATAGLTLLAAPFGARWAAAAVAAVAMVNAAVLARSARAASPIGRWSGEATRLFLLPLIGTVTAAWTADAALRAEGIAGPPALAVTLGCAALGWLLAIWALLPDLHRALPVLATRRD